MNKRIQSNRPFLIALGKHFDEADPISRTTSFIMGDARLSVRDKWNNGVQLYDFEVSQKASGKGHGSKALKEFCKIADRFNVATELYCEFEEGYDYPFPSLLEFYQRHGFVIQDQVSLEMLRKPGATITPYLGRV